MAPNPARLSCGAIFASRDCSGVFLASERSSARRGHDRNDPDRLGAVSHGRFRGAAAGAFPDLAVKTGLFSPTIIPRLWHTWSPGRSASASPCTAKSTDQRPLLLASNHISWSDITVIVSASPTSAFISKSELAGWPIFGTLARLQRTIFIERDRKRHVGRAGERDGRAPGRRRRDGAVCRRQHGRRQFDPAVQEHAVRRRRNGDRSGAADEGLYPAGGHRLYARAWHADGPAAPAARRLDRRHRSGAASGERCCAKVRWTSRCTSASRSNSMPPATARR